MIYIKMNFKINFFFRLEYLKKYDLIGGDELYAQYIFNQVLMDIVATMNAFPLITRGDLIQSKVSCNILGQVIKGEASLVATISMRTKLQNVLGI